jgi:putative transposase
MDKKPKRKNLRLRNFDYSQPGYYFVTICTRDKQKLLSSIAKGGPFDAPAVQLTLAGKEIVKAIDFLES